MKYNDKGSHNSDNSDNPDGKSPDSSLLKKMREKVIDAEKLYKDFFDLIDRWEQLAKYGCLKENVGSYKANVTDQVIQQLVASLYAQNPKVKASIRERIDYTVWNGDATQLDAAIAVVRMAPELAANGINPQTPQIMEADAIVQDAYAVHKYREFLERKGKTLELAYLYFLDEQSEDFFSNFQQVIRRALISSIGWVKLGFQREMGFDGVTERKIGDQREQIKRAESLDGEEGSEEDRAADIEEKKRILKGLEAQEIILREGLVFDFPLVRNVIIDTKAISWANLNSADWMCEIHDLTKQERSDEFPNIDFNKIDGANSTDGGKIKVHPTEKEEKGSAKASRGMSEEDFYRVYEFYSKTDGLCYWFMDGYDEYLREPDVPNVDVEGFFPYENLIFNPNENKDDTTPVSDVSKMQDAQEALNQKRQWSLDHTRHSLPKYVAPATAMDNEVKKALETSDEVGLVILLKALQDGQKVSDILQKLETVGLDPNMYATYEQTQDITMSTNASQAQVGNTSKGTATAASIAQSSYTNVVDVKKAAVDKLLNRISRKSSQILQTEMSAESIQEIVGRGAVWEESSRADIHKEVYLKIEAGSSGLPNEAEELMKSEKLLPLMLQNPQINPMWLAETMIKLMDSKVDLSSAILESPALAVENASTEAMGMNQVMGGINAPAIQGGAPRKPQSSHTTGGGYVPSANQANTA